MYTLDITKVENLPGASKTYQNGEGFCAMAKIFIGVGLQVPIRNASVVVSSYETNEFIVQVAKGLNNDYDWSHRVTLLNDSLIGDFEENHRKAFEMAVDLCLQSGVVQLKNSMCTQQQPRELVTA